MPKRIAALSGRIGEAAVMKIYGDSISGNCLKVKWVADSLGLSYAWIETDILAGQTRKPAYLPLNAAGQAPLVNLDDGRPPAGRAGARTRRRTPRGCRAAP